MLHLTREFTGLSSLGTIFEGQVATYTRIACSVVLHVLHCYRKLDMRIRVSLSGRIIIAHALSLPLKDRHTGMVMFNELSRLLDALCENWRDKVLFISADGDRSMDGSMRGVATRMENISKPVSLRIWCGDHQVDLFVQGVFKYFDSGSFYKELMDVVSYLRRRKNLIEKMKRKCPKIADTGCYQQGERRLGLYRIVVSQHIEENSPPRKSTRSDNHGSCPDSKGSQSGHLRCTGSDDAFLRARV
jgi:hypothetical protein